MAIAVADLPTFRPIPVNRPVLRQRTPIDTNTSAWMRLPESQRMDLAARMTTWLEDFFSRHSAWETETF